MKLPSALLIPRRQPELRTSSEASLSSELHRKSQAELRPTPLGFSYLGDFPPPAIVGVSGEAGGVVGAAGGGGGADAGRRGDARLPARLAKLQEFEASPLGVLPEETRLGGELREARWHRLEHNVNLLPLSLILLCLFGVKATRYLGWRVRDRRGGNR